MEGFLSLLLTLWLCNGVYHLSGSPVNTTSISLVNSSQAFPGISVTTPLGGLSSNATTSIPGNVGPKSSNVSSIDLLGNLSFNASSTTLNDTSRASADGFPASSLGSSPSNQSENSNDSSTNAIEEFLFATTQGTTLEQLNEIIEKYGLPKSGRTEELNWGELAQWYFCNITFEKVMEVANHPRIQGVSPVNREFSADDDTDSDRNHTSSRLSERAIERRDDVPTRTPGLWRRWPASPQLQILSRDTINTMALNYQGFLYDEALGAGSTIYVIDSGFNLDHEEFTERPGPIRSWYVDNEFTGGDLPEDIKDYAGYLPRKRKFIGHGTATASLAGGNTLSMAPKAELVMIKAVGNHRKRGGGYEATALNPAGLSKALKWIIDDVKAEDSRRRKSVVSITTKSIRLLSSRLEGLTLDPAENVYTQFLTECQELGIVVVVAAGDEGNRWASAGPESWDIKEREDPGAVPASLDFLIPQRMSEGREAQLITVGGVHHDGTLFPRTTPRVGQSGGRGWIDIYAMAYRVEAAYNEDTTSYVQRDGTAFAASSIASLIAYFFSIPLLYDTLPDDPKEFILQTKRLVQANSYNRYKTTRRGPVLDMLGNDKIELNYYVDPESGLPLPINRAWRSYCGTPIDGAPLKRDLKFFANDTTIEDQINSGNALKPRADLPVTVDDTMIEAACRRSPVTNSASNSASPMSSELTSSATSTSKLASLPAAQLSTSTATSGGMEELGLIFSAMREPPKATSSAKSSRDLPVPQPPSSCQLTATDYNMVLVIRGYGWNDKLLNNGLSLYENLGKCGTVSGYVFTWLAEDPSFNGEAYRAGWQFIAGGYVDDNVQTSCVEYAMVNSGAQADSNGHVMGSCTGV